MKEGFLFKQISKIPDWGVHSDPRDSVKRQTRLLNLFSLGFLILGVCYVPLFIHFQNHHLMAALTAMIGALLTVLLLNRFGKIQASRWIYLGSMNIFVFAISLILGKDSGVHLVWLALVSTPFMIFDVFHQRKSVIFFVLLPILLWWAHHAATTLPKTPWIQPEEPAPFFRILLTIGVHLIFLLQLAFVASTNFWYEKLHQERKKQLETSGKMALLGEMAGHIAHEINNPLAIIQAYSLRIRKELEDPGRSREKIAERLDMVDLTVEKMAAIVRSLLIYSKSANRSSFARAELKNIVDNVAALSRLKREEYGIQLKISEIPDLVLECRDIEIMQVLLNLILNSCEAVRTLGEKWIQVDVVPGISQLTIRVTDSGRGIPDEVAKKMMEPFFSTKSSGEGIGLGLSLSKGMIEGHDGQLEYDPNYPHTRFLVKIPYRQTGVAATPTLRSST